MKKEVNGVQYDIGKLDAMKQFHVARRLGPVLAEVVKAVSAMPDKPDQPDAEHNFEFIEIAAGPLMKFLSEMPDETAEYMVYTCLDVVKRESAGGWAPVKAPGQKILMFKDIDMRAMLELSVAVITENLSGFFPGAQPNS